MKYVVGTSKQLAKALKNINTVKMREGKIILSIPNDFVDHSIRGVVALDDNNVAGVWQFNLGFFIKKNKKLISIATFVSKKYRKQGIAKQLWRTGLDKYNPLLVDVTAVSDRGYTLIKSISKEYPQIIWLDDEDGERKLRDLRKCHIERII
jgi:GNAT superfamily N-acetyltransferase